MHSREPRMNHAVLQQYVVYQLAPSQTPPHRLLMSDIDGDILLVLDAGGWTTIPLVEDRVILQYGTSTVHVYRSALSRLIEINHKPNPRKHSLLQIFLHFLVAFKVNRQVS